VKPNTIAAYSALDGKRLYGAETEGKYPAPPTFDRVRNRVLVSDGVHVYCYRATDLKLAWKSVPAKGVHVSYQPNSVVILPDGGYAALRRVRRGSTTGNEIAAFEPEGGKLQWTACIAKYERSGQSYTRVYMTRMPVFGRRFLYIPSGEQERVKQGRGWTYKTSMAMYVADRKTGKILRKFAKDSPNTYPMAGVPADGHAAFVVREYLQKERKYRMVLSVLSGESGTAVHEEELKDLMTAAAHSSFAQQAQNPVLTGDGRLLVSTGRGLACYGSADAHGTKPGPDTKEKP
jgi:hypothetical protein